MQKHKEESPLKESGLEMWTGHPTIPTALGRMEDGEVIEDDDVVFLSERPIQGHTLLFMPTAHVPETPALPVFALVTFIIRSYGFYDL